MIAPVLADIAKEHEGKIQTRSSTSTTTRTSRGRYEVMSIPDPAGLANGEVKEASRRREGQAATARGALLRSSSIERIGGASPAGRPRRRGGGI